MSKTGPATSSPSYASAASKPPASLGYSPPSPMFPTAAGRKPHVRREVATALGVGANRGQRHAPKSRPSSNSPLSSPFENISAPFAQTAPEQAILASELSVRLEPLAEGSVATNTQLEMDEEREVALLASPAKPPSQEMPLGASQTSSTARQGSVSPVGQISADTIVIAGLLERMIERQEQLIESVKNNHVDTIYMMRHEVMDRIDRMDEDRRSSVLKSSRRTGKKTETGLNWTDL